MVIAALGACVFFLYPTIKWYFFTDRDEKTIISSSKQQIMDYAIKQAGEGLSELKSLVKSDPGQMVPEKYGFLLEAAKTEYKNLKEPQPKTWNMETLLAAFKNETALRTKIEDHYRNRILKLKDQSANILQLGLDLSGGMSVLLEADMSSLAKRLDHEPSAEDKSAAVDRAMEVLNNRIDKFGVTEPQIRRQGTEQISIEIPGAADPERVQSFLLGKGSLNFHIVDDEVTQQLNDYIAQNPSLVLGDGSDVVQPAFLPAGTVVRGFYKKDKYGIDRRQNYLAITAEPGLAGEHIREAQVGNDPVTGQPVINFVLDSEGGEIFFKMTSANVKKTLAIVLDDKVKAGARISEPIRESVRMTGFDRKEAQDIALVLRTGAMPVDLKIANLQAIGASLGEDTVRLGLRAMALGFGMVIIFMLLYYKGAGFVADITQILNLYIIISILSAFNLTLTLTSIAGLVLTIGMAVDANVIIYERIKEEYRLGKSAEASVKAGYKKAFWTIMDSNLTTFIAAIFLSQLGSGPIQGFAYTLAVGIVSSMFTSLVVSRLMFDFGVDVLRIKRLSITWRKVQ
ncbi:MAG: protein translocase subunit SecD [Spirochaetales bacterium]|nr:MAG: protein translocase subunit SecD [Spirochaetales bacterium]